MNQQPGFNERLRQILILILILLIAVLLISQLTIFIPGMLGGITLYILSRTLYFQLIFKKNGKQAGQLCCLYLPTSSLLPYLFI